MQRVVSAVLIVFPVSLTVSLASCIELKTDPLLTVADGGANAKAGPETPGDADAPDAGASDAGHIIVPSGCLDGNWDGGYTGDDDAIPGASVEVWPNGVVPVCFDAVDFDDSRLAEAKRILDTTGWTVVANVSFTGWGKCGSSPSSIAGEVRVHFAPFEEDGITFQRGHSPLGARGTFSDLTLTNNSNDEPTRFRFQVLHEFGRVLGWTHGSSNPQAQGEPNRTAYVDFQSIMNDCNGYSQMLSRGDVYGVQSVYGKKNPIASGQNGSNNALARSATTLDAFFVRSDGSVWTSSASSALKTSWTTMQLEGAVPGKVPPDAPIAAVARAPYARDIFYVDNDGGVRTSYLNEGAGTFVLPGTYGLATPGQQVAAIASSPGSMDVLFAGKDGGLYLSRWSAQCGRRAASQCNWAPAVKVVSDGSVPEGAAVTAVARMADAIDVFFIGKDGEPRTVSCFGTFESDNGIAPPAHSCAIQEWTTSSLSTPAECHGRPGSGIAAVARTGGSLDVFYASTRNSMCTISWAGDGAPWTVGTFGSANIVPQGASITALARSADNLDVFFMGADAAGSGVMYHAGLGSGGWTTTSLGAPTGARGDVRGVAGSAMGAVAKTPANLDIFVTLMSTSNAIDGLATASWSTGTNESEWTKYAVYTSE